MEREDAEVLGALLPGPGAPPPPAALRKAWPLSRTDFRLRRTGLFTVGSRPWVLDGCLLHHPETQRSWDWLSALSEHTSGFEIPVLVPTATLARGRVLFQLRRYRADGSGCLIDLVVFDPSVASPWIVLRGPGPLRWAGVKEVRHFGADVVFLLGPMKTEESAQVHAAGFLPGQPDCWAYRLDLGRNTYEVWTGEVPDRDVSLLVAVQGGSVAEASILGQDSVELRLGLRGAAICVQRVETLEEYKVPVAKPLLRSTGVEEFIRAASDGWRLLVMDATRGDVVQLSHYKFLPRGPHGPLASFPTWHPPAHRRPSDGS